MRKINEELIQFSEYGTVGPSIGELQKLNGPVTVRASFREFIVWLIKQGDSGQLTPFILNPDKYTWHSKLELFIHQSLPLSELFTACKLTIDFNPEVPKSERLEIVKHVAANCRGRIRT